jgi:hypothetical protein
MAESKPKPKAELYKKYPAGNVALYNGTTILHFLIGTIGIMIGYSFFAWGYIIGFIYLIFAFGQMYIMMPLVVCPNCVYYKMEGAVCTSGMNVWSRKIAKEGSPKNFSKRGEGPFCHNNMYMGALFIPLVAMIPALIINFSFLLLILFLAVLGLLMLRFMVVFMRTACPHCYAKYQCPNAQAMGLADKKQ